MYLVHVIYELWIKRNRMQNGKMKTEINEMFAVCCCWEVRVRTWKAYPNPVQEKWLFRSDALSHTEHTMCHPKCVSVSACENVSALVGLVSSPKTYIQKPLYPNGGNRTTAAHTKHFCAAFENPISWHQHPIQFPMCVCPCVCLFMFSSLFFVLNASVCWHAVCTISSAKRRLHPFFALKCQCSASIQFVCVLNQNKNTDTVTNTHAYGYNVQHPL